MKISLIRLHLPLPLFGDLVIAYDKSIDCPSSRFHRCYESHVKGMGYICLVLSSTKELYIPFCFLPHLSKTQVSTADSKIS